MSVVELSKTVDSLARLIVERTNELEKLKKLYNENLEVVNQYVRSIQDMVGSDQEADEIEEREFTTIIKTPISCPNCLHEVYSNEPESNFILVPKHQLKRIPMASPESSGNMNSKLERLSIADKDNKSTSKEVNRVLKDNRTQPSSPVNTYNSYNQSRHNNTKSKRICSYCKKTGHSRAKCLVRLSTPPHENKQ